MKISEIVDQLGEKYTVLILNDHFSADESITRIETLDNKNHVLHEGILYITSAEILNSLDADISSVINFILISEKDQVKQQSEKYNVICLLTPVDSTAIYLEARNILEENIIFNSNVSELYGCLLQDDYLEGLMEKAYEFMDNPLMFYDYTHRIKTHIHKKPVNNPIWMRALELGTHDFETIDETFYKGLKEISETRDPKFTDAAEDRYATCSVVYKENLIGFVSVLEHYHKLRKYDLKYLRVIADIIAIKSAKDNFTNIEDELNYTHLLRDLLEKKINTLNDLQTRLKTRNWKEKPVNCILLIQIADNIPQSYINFIKHSLLYISMDIKIVHHDSYIVILEEYQNESERKIFHEKILSFIIQSNLMVGVSNVFNSLLDLQKYYDQGKKALYYNELFELQCLVNYYSDFQLIDFVKQCNDNIVCEEYYHPALSYFDPA